MEPMAYSIPKQSIESKLYICNMSVDLYLPLRLPAVRHVIHAFDLKRSSYCAVIF
jgi:hypothetical protein